MQQWLIETGNELIGDDQETIRVLLEIVRNVFAGKIIEAGLSLLLAADLELARVRDDGLVWALDLH
ncbi:hypothetical protein D9M72_570980 [compost metagenome]